jgi:cellulose synthase/poly-beta-1,6-N-acetylglucosamine synthase-like glycosyltransferase
MILLLFFILFFVGYSVLIIYYWQIWTSIPDFMLSAETLSLPVSIIIPARNEEDNIGQLLQALHDQTYPKEFFEIIVINDHSTDATVQIAMQFPGVKLVNLEEDEINSYKKKAVAKGIAVASGSLIITTDADCIPPPGWVQAIVSFKERSKAVLIVAPVALDCNSDIVQVFQAMDFMVLQGITGASVHKKIHTMCNGANLAYERNVFYEVNGFTGIDHIASGDDMLLMHKIATKYPDRLYYLKSIDAIVSTQPMTSWSSFFNQRIRWASKALHYNDKRIFWILLLVYLFNLSFLVLLLAGWWNHMYWLFFLIAWIAKTMVELPLFYSIAGFFNKQWAIKWFFFFQPLHIFYTIVSGLFGQFGKYEWKGRQVK